MWSQHEGMEAKKTRYVIGKMHMYKKFANFNYLFFAGGGFGGKKESGQLRFGGRDRPFKRPIVPNILKSNR